MSGMPIPQRGPTALDQGAALMDPAGPFGMEQALAQQQQQGNVQQQDQTKQIIDQLKKEKDGIAGSNKVKELALKLKEEMQKSQELTLDLEDNPDAMDVAVRALSKARREQLQG